MTPDRSARQRPRRLNLVPAFVLVGLIFMSIGAIPLITGLPGQLQRSADSYDASPTCGPSVTSAIVAASTACRFSESGTVTNEFTSPCGGRYATLCYNVVLTTSSGLSSTTDNEILYNEVAIGASYPVEIWQSKITCIFVQPSVCTRTGDNPDLVASNNRPVWMLLLIGIGLMIAGPPLVYELANRRRHRGRNRA